MSLWLRPSGVACALALLLGPFATVSTAQESPKPAKEESGGNKKKKKKKKKQKDDGKKAESSAKAALDEGEAVELPGDEEKNGGDWCDWLSGRPGTLYSDKDNPYVQLFRLGGRFHYQAAYVDGNDVNGRDFHDRYDEYRRFRMEARVDFLRYFTADVSVNLVDDSRFREPPDDDLDWGYDRFDEASLTFDFGGAVGTGWFDDIKLSYGRMKLRVTEEDHQSSRRILTIERSALADKMGGEMSRPTAAMATFEKDDWTLSLGVISGEDDSEFIGGWNDGRAYYASLGWEVNKRFRLLLDHVQNHASGGDDFLGYRQGTSLAGVYEDDRWGFLANVVYGDNGGAANLRPQARRQGDFHGVIVMPWYWIVEKRLQAVVQYQYARSEESEGLQLGSRYVRARHDNPLIDDNNGRGDEHHALYFGLNYHFCGDNAKLMGGILYDRMNAPDGVLEALTYAIAFRTYF